MADQDLNTNSAPDLGGDDTRTRKTVRMAPSMNSVATLKLPGAGNAGETLADPLANRDTDTGNLDVLDDTQTRKTVKLKPIRPQDPAAVPNINLGGNTAGQTAAPAPAPVPAPAAPKADGANTNTRKTVVLKPAAAPSVSLDGSNTNTRKTVVLKPAAAPSVPLDGSNTNTRKTVVLKPASAVNIPLPGTAPAAKVDDATQVNARIKPAEGPKVELSDATQVNARVKPAVDDDRTVKIVRPPRLTPAPVPAPAPVPESDEAIKETIVLPDEDDVSRATVVMPEEEGVSRSTVVLPELDEGDTQTRKNVVLPNNSTKDTVALSTQDLTEAAKELEEDVADNGEEKTIVLTDSVLEKELPFNQDNTGASSSGGFDDLYVTPKAAKASPVYLTLMIISLLAVAVAATLQTTDYLEIWEGVRIGLKIPGLNR